MSGDTAQGKTLPGWIQFWEKRSPETPAFVFCSPTGRRVFSRKDVLDLSSRFAYRLVNNGVHPGDIVCISLPNSPERIVVEYGVHLAGAVTMNGQVLRSDGEDLIGSLVKAKCSFMVVDQMQKSGAWQVCSHAFGNLKVQGEYAVVKSERMPSLRAVFFCNLTTVSPSSGFLESLPDGRFINERIDPESVCSIFTTSGSTGYSKLVPYTHKNIITSLQGVLETMGLNKDGQRFFNTSPLGWIGGCPLFYPSTGLTRILIDEGAGPVQNKSSFIWEILRKEGATSAHLLPAVAKEIIQMKHHSGYSGEHKLSLVITGGQPLNVETIQNMLELAENVFAVYASSECVLMSFMKINLDNLRTFRPKMAGYPLDGVQLRVVDKDLNVVPAETRGEILVHSPSMAKEYIGDDASVKASFLPDGWFRTGDFGSLTQNGCLFVEGRSSEAIMHGAYILYPSWLEQVLVKCPGLQEVVIVPVPDKLLYHEICACVRVDDEADVKLTADDIIDFCQKETVLDKSSSLNIIPKYVLFFDAFPRTTTDKLDRRKLSALAQEMLNL